ncbi:HdeD family acid-resistance protein [Microbacterium xanthum]|uniref:HdeD family acid-resistance protein n=1 Tax=Microbacterium xanthum TaxID=3079794 RepID=UPI002AD3FDC2|nr:MULTISPECIES: DUF308 domain-containing protein [unclassified Microbacterium]MDZ8171544.1 DUF308 domain-containing protein [Microbacterium sp. KSW-48]MDZ8200417.1 DUF308 domain-containing protein [Microbacterium sp. SSW1-59]
MATKIDAPEHPKTGARAAFGIGGVLAFAIGVLILVWPERTAFAATALVAAYAIGAGLVYGFLGLLSREQRARTRVARISAAVVFLILGVVALANLSRTTAWLALFLGVAIGVVWIVEGILALVTVRESEHRTLSVLFAIVAFAAGVVLLVSPLWGVSVLWWLLGLSLIALGAMNAYRAFRPGSRAAD